MFLFGVVGVDQLGVVAAEFERAGHALVGDVQGAGVVEEVPPDGVGGGGVVAGQVAGEEAVEVAGDFAFDAEEEYILVEHGTLVVHRPKPRRRARSAESDAATPAEPALSH